MLETQSAPPGAIELADLPRLTDEEREALDGYVAVEGVPNDLPPARKVSRLSLLTRIRLWSLQRAVASAEQYLAACQDASEKYPGLYEALVRDAEQSLARLRRRVASL